MSENRLTRRIFIWDYTKCRNNWCHEVKNILKSIDFGDKYLSALNNTQNAIISTDAAKDKLMQKYKHKWGNDVASQTKLDNYKIMKQEFGAEEYVKFVMSKKLRSTLVQLRAGCLPIEIELGRYLQIPRNERLCKQCTSGTVENEKHFLFHCTRYSDIRHDFTTEINSGCPPDSGDEDKIIKLFSSRTLIIKTAHFILDALKIRVS